MAEAAARVGFARRPPPPPNSATPTGGPADTLAKLTWSLHHNDLPDWAEAWAVHLAVVDEAGMADTLTLDAAVKFIIGRGGSVRLVGDDQQLAAIGAGGVLRDIPSTATAPSGSPSCTGSTTLQRPPPPSPSATANPKHSASTWTGNAPGAQPEMSPTNEPGAPRRRYP